jgi:tetratricopeptide (TPR) repeat protein
VIRSCSGYPKGQPLAIAWFAAGHAALAQSNYDEALQSFRKVLDKDLTPKFFMHWYWRMHAQLGVANVWLASGNLRNARAEAGCLLESVLLTADPNLQTLAWDVNARVAIAERDWQGAEQCVQKGLSTLARFEIPSAAWRLHATAWDLYRNLKNSEAAEASRKRAEGQILKLLNSFDANEPLRAILQYAAPVRQILREKVANAIPRQSKLRRSAAP